MTDAQIASLVAAVVLLLTNLAGLVKVWIDLSKQKADRVTTKATRDQDSLELHDAVQKATWDIGILKDNARHKDTLIEDLQKQINTLNSTLAVTNVQLNTLVDAIKDLKK